MRETQVSSLTREDPLEKEMATHSSILAWDRGAWLATVHGVTELDMTERINRTITFCKFFHMLCSPCLGLPLLFPTVLLHLDKPYLFLRSKLERTLSGGPFLISRLALGSFLCALKTPYVTIVIVTMLYSP